MIQPNPPPSFYSTDQAGPSSEPLHPRTPSFDNSIYTPNHSSPTTPYLELQTPVQLPNKAKPQRLAASMDVESATEEVEGDVMKASAPRSSSAIGVGLGLGMKESNQPTSVEANHFQGHQASSPISMSTTVHRSRSESTDSSEGSLDPAELPSPDELQKMLLRVAELEKTASEDWLESAHSAELAVMLRRILTPATVQLPILMKQVEAQRETIKTLQQQAKLSDQMSRVERDRHMAEKASWHAETRALDIVREREIAAGTRPKGVWDMDVGYHQELEAANKRLEMDNRLMAPRLADTQGQIDKLVHELRHLRSQVLLQTGTMAADSQRVHTTQVNKSTAPAPSRSSANRANHALMGDARTEHLLLAARKVRSMRENDERVGKLTLEELKRGGVVGPDGGLGYSEGYGGVMDDESDELEEISEEEEKPTVQSRRNSVRGKGKNATPLLPRAKRTGKKDPSGPTTPRARRTSISARVAPPTTTPGGGNFSDLLRAAEMATRPGSPSPDARASTVMSAPRLPLGDDNLTERGSPVKRARRQPPTPTGGWEPGHARRGSRFEGEESNERGAEEDEASALDLLVEASQLDFAQSQGASQDEGPSSQVSSAARFGGLLGVGEQTTGGQSPKSSSGESALGPAIDLRFNSNGNRLGNHGESRSHVRPTGLELDGTQIHSQHSTSAHKTPKKPRPRAASNAGVADIHTPARMYHNPHDASRTLPPTFDTPANSQDRDYGATPMTSISQMSPPSSINRRNVIMGDDLPPGAYNSPTGGTVPGLGKYVHLTSSMPARRMRSPYLKWTEEEDELLARAVAMHGEKWDLVSKGVPTRSYHQVRQRWLRKTGAFDKKTAMSTEPTTGSALKTDPAEDDDDGSPTPAGGATPTGKKRKMMDEGQ